MSRASMKARSPSLIVSLTSSSSILSARARVSNWSCSDLLPSLNPDAICPPVPTSQCGPGPGGREGTRGSASGRGDPHVGVVVLHERLGAQHRTDVLGHDSDVGGVLAVGAPVVLGLEAHVEAQRCVAVREAGVADDLRLDQAVDLAGQGEQTGQDRLDLRVTGLGGEGEVSDVVEHQCFSLSEPKPAIRSSMPLTRKACHMVARLIAMTGLPSSFSSSAATAMHSRLVPHWISASTSGPSTARKALRSVSGVSLAIDVADAEQSPWIAATSKPSSVK